MKKTMSILLSVIMMMVLAVGCLSAAAAEPQQSTDTTVLVSSQSTAAKKKQAKSKSQKSIGIPNPYVDCRTMKQAEKIAGFSMKAPKTAAGLKKSGIQAIRKQMIQVIYSGSKNKILVRKAIGRKDISGDYNKYPCTRAISVNKHLVKIRGTKSKAYVATWTSGKYTYSVDSARGISTKQMGSIVKAVA